MVDNLFPTTPDFRDDVVDWTKICGFSRNSNVKDLLEIISRHFEIHRVLSCQQLLDTEGLLDNKSRSRAWKMGQSKV